MKVPVNNLELWNKVQKTNPNYTKKANVKGNQITSIAPQYQILNATEQFGVYGVTWGFKELVYDYNLKDLGLVSLHAVFFFPNGEFPISNSISIWRDNAQTKIDDNFAKKLETDALTKALSKLGFNADIFLGKFDNQRYLDDVKKEFAEPVKKSPLTDKGFSYLTDQGSYLEIQKALSEREVTSIQKKALELLLKEQEDNECDATIVDIKG